MKLRLTSALVLVLGVAVFAGPALAGNGHGNGNANGNGNGNGNGNAAAADASATGDSSPGNSGNAPGQLKKDAEAAPAAPAAPAEADVVAEVEPANSEGVKPSNSTAKDTHEAASSDKTKEYGNGKTAGQIAIANGAGPSTTLHGPGNSQPHKAAGCAGGHEVDVHALKGKGHQKGCGTSSPPVVPAPQPNGDPGSNPGPSSNPGQSSNPHVAADPKPEAASTPPADPATTPPADPGTSSPPSAGVASGSVEHGSHGVLAAAAVVAHGTLPFTGVQLWAIVLFALMLVALGLALRRQAAPVQRTDR
jgi:hypothetical protein